VSLELPPGTLISLLVNESGEPRLPTPEEIIQANDEIIAVTIPTSEEGLLDALTRVAV
jgi:hypothetical protein